MLFSKFLTEIGTGKQERNETKGAVAETLATLGQTARTEGTEDRGGRAEREDREGTLHTIPFRLYLSLSSFSVFFLLSLSSASVKRKTQFAHRRSSPHTKVFEVEVQRRVGTRRERERERERER